MAGLLKEALGGMAAADGWTGGLAIWGGRSDHRLDWTSAAILVLNLLDGIFTLGFLQWGVARELNPVMRAAYEGSPLVFMGVKLAAVYAGVALLRAHAGSSTARLALQAGACCYAALVAYHLAFLASLA